MYSKFKSVTCSLIMTTAILGCGLKIGETVIPPAPAKVESATCIDLSMKNMKMYFSGDASDEQVVESMQCIQNVLIAFKENIRGETKDVYTAREIVNFIESNFLKTEGPSVFTNELLSQFMKFKVAFVGGNEQFIHKNEIDKIANLIALFKLDIVALNKSMKILTFKWQPAVSTLSESAKEIQFLQAKADLLTLVKKISSQFKLTGNAYQLDDLIEFIKEVSKIAQASEGTLAVIEKARPFIKKFKLILIGGDSSLQKQEWNRLGLTLNEGFFQVLRMEYFLNNLQPIDTQARWVGYQKMAIDLSALIETLLITKETKNLSNYELAELSDTLKNIYPDLSLSITLWESLGHIKIMLLGDSPSGRFGWSRSDFVALRAKIPTLFEELALVVTTYQSMTNGNRRIRTSLSYDEFVVAQTKIFAAVERISTLVEKPYNIYSLKGLLVELSRGLLSETLVLPENFDALFNVALSVKTIVTSQADNNLTVGNLRLLFRVGVRGLFNYLEYDLFLKPYPADSSAFYSNFGRFIESVRRTINFNLAFKSIASYSRQDLIQLPLTLQSEKLVQWNLRLSSLEKLFDGLLHNVLNPPEFRLLKKPRPRFDMISLKILADEVQRFIKLQEVYFSAFEIQPTLSKPALLDFINRTLAQNQDPLLKASLIESKLFLESKVLLNFDENGFLKILTVDMGQYHIQDQKNSNLARALGRIIIRSYANELPRVESLVGVTLDEAQFAFSQFSDLIVDLDLVARLDSTFISSRFLESNLFLTTSDGNSLASFSEIHQLVLHIMSGLSRSQVIKEKVVKTCQAPIVDLKLTEIFVDEECLLKFYATEDDAFSQLPQFLGLRSQFSAAEMKDYYLSLLKAAGHVQNDSKLVMMTNADLFPHVVQYIETVFQRFDLNRDQALDKDEALAAYPVYRELTKDLTKDYNLKETELPGVFIYLLKFSKVPKTIPEKIAFKLFINNPDKWIIRSTRIDLGKIFNFIAESMKPKPAQPVVAPEQPPELPKPAAEVVGSLAHAV